MATNFLQKREKAFVSGNGGRHLGARGFTLVELLVSTAIMLIVMLVLLQVIAGMTNIWHNSIGTISSFQSARAAFTTLTRTLSRATLKTYIDYVDSTGAPITNTNVNGTFTPIASYSRSSELQFVCGPTISTNGVAAGGIPAAKQPNYPGDCVFFQAPLGITNSSIAGAASDKFLQRSLNTIGFYVSYVGLNGTNSLPGWLSTALGTVAAPSYKLRLMEFIQPTENVNIYNTTNASGVGAYNADMNYIPLAIQGSAVNNYALPGTVGINNQSVVVAENVVLLIIRPRLEPQDEAILAGPGGKLNGAPNGPYSTTTANSIISPNYYYDSRAWWGGYSISHAQIAAAYFPLMRNQLPPILDVAMVAVDPNSIIRLGNLGATLAATCPLLPQAATSPFTNSANMDADLTTFGAWLASNHIRYRIFRASVQMEGAAWVNN